MKYLLKRPGLLLCLPVLLAFTDDNNDVRKVIDKLTGYYAAFPQEKIYLHTDKPLYAAGEDIWFKAYLVDASLHTPVKTGTTIYAELFDSDKKLIARHVLPVKNGWAAGDFHLSDSLYQGKYIIRAYTKNMQNTDPGFFFQKEIQVLNPAFAGEKTQVQQEKEQIDLQFFPEGGNFLSGVENGLAFKATNRNGKGADVEGEIRDVNNNFIAAFKSVHNGMGMVRIKAATGDKYRAVLKNNPDVYYLLPDVVETGYMLRIDDRGANMRVTLFDNIKQPAGGGENNTIYIVAHSRGIVHYASKGVISSNQAAVFKIPKLNAPTGITHITLFDKNFVPQCERLFFVNNNDFLGLSATTDKNIYKKREMVKMDISVHDKIGNPVKGNFSVSVYDLKVKEIEKYPCDITNYFTLGSDLKGTVEEPGFYFKDTLPQTRLFLDLVMLTHGWRRFKWETVLSDSMPYRQYYPEKWLTLSGRVMKLLSKKPAVGSSVKVLTGFGDMIVAKTDQLGIFYVDSLFYYDSTKIIIETDNARGKQSDFNLKIDPFAVSPGLLYTPSVFINVASEDYLLQNKHRNDIEKLKLGKGNILLGEIEVKGRKEPQKTENKVIRPYGTADYVITSKDILPTALDIMNAIQGRVAGLQITGIGSGTSVSIRGGGEPLYLLDGMQVPIDILLSIPIQNVESVDILTNPGTTSMYGGRGSNGVIAVYTKRGGGFYQSSPGISQITYPGYYRAREFYVPKYDTPSSTQNNPDIRTTMYWNPGVAIDSAGKSTVSFFTSDVVSGFRIVIEGVSDKGIPGSSSRNIEVR